jgi:hypothetical protein
LALGPWGATPALVEGMTRMGAAMPFREAVEHVAFFTGTRVAPTRLRRITEQIGGGVVAAQQAEAEAIARALPAVPEPDGPVLQVSVDGAMAPTIGESTTEWVEVKTMVIGVVTTREAEDGTLQVETEKLSYFSRAVEAEQFTTLALVETQRRGLERAEQVAAVNDGAEWITGFVDVHRVDARRVLDYSHAADAVDEAAKATCDTSAEAARRSMQWREVLRHGESGAVLEVMAEAASEAAARGQAAGEVFETKLQYLRKRREQITYAAFEREGVPIGSGAVESAHKTQVQRRLKGAGMRWRRANVDGMCALANGRSNERWDETLAGGIEQVRAQAARRRQERRQQRAERSAVRQAEREPGPEPRQPDAPALEAGPEPPAAREVVEQTDAATAQPPTNRSRWIPPPTHPWRRPFKAQRENRVA